MLVNIIQVSLCAIPVWWFSYSIPLETIVDSILSSLANIVVTMSRRTVCRTAVFEGIGLHSGRRTRVSVNPAQPGAGILFRRTDVAGSAPIPALWNNVGNVTLCTTLTIPGGLSVATVEHLMAALSAAGVDDAEVLIDGGEVPILDGSAAPFFAGLEAVGFQIADQRRQKLRVTETVEVAVNGSRARLEPHNGFAVECVIAFQNPLVGQSCYSADLIPERFADDIAPARTFVFEKDVAQLRERGLALGGSLDNAVVVGADKVLNPGGLRFTNEFSRHKALDAIGDLYLAGAPILGRYVSFRAGHALNNALVKALMSRPSAWCWA
jgi:UDP-3-O-[3-hydroxymyristoyl] N-acetylglucosamine deacetylase